MIRSVIVQNYKSLEFIEIDVGTFNILIGENGAGKSNFLEVIASYSAIISNSFTNEFLSSRGIRVADSKSTFSCFKNKISDQINFAIFNEQKVVCKISITLNKTNPYAPLDYEINFVQRSLDGSNELEIINMNQIYEKEFHNNILNIISNKFGSPNSFLNLMKDRVNDLENIKDESTVPPMDEDFERLVDYLSRMSNIKEIADSHKIPSQDNTSQFIIYSPELSSLRNFSSESQIEPLGVNGEGLLKLLQVMQEHEPENFKKVCELVEMFQWVEKIKIDDEDNNIEKHIKIVDRFMGKEIDHRSANEGFLFVLFYAALFCSKFTPKSFAVDNIDASLNPKLCRVLIKQLVQLAKDNNKQAFVTTHNPAILDGLDLHDDEQRLFVVERNDDGATQLRRVGVDDLPKPKRNGETIKLSEAFMRGHLGGLPTNF